MSAPMSVISENIESLSSPVLISQLDVAGQEAFSAFRTAVQGIQDIVTPYPPTAAVALTATDRTNLEFYINFIKDMLHKGYTPPSGQPRQFLTIEEARQADFLFQSLKAVGINVDVSSVSFGTLAKAQEWQLMVASSLILDTLFNFASTKQNRSIQALVELNYVSTGNELLAEQLEDLQSALGLTQSALSSLATLQGLHNEITVSQQPRFTAIFNLLGKNADSSFMSLEQFEVAYKNQASAFFGTPISPTTSLFPTDPLSNYLISQNIPADVVGLGATGLTIIDDFRAFNRNNAFYAYYLGNGDYDLYKLGDARAADITTLTPIVRYHIATGAPAGNFIMSGVDFTGAPSAYGATQVTLDYRLASDTGAGLSHDPFFLITSSSIADKMNNDFFYASHYLIPQNLSVDGTYKGIYNPSNANVAEAIANFFTGAERTSYQNTLGQTIELFLDIPSHPIGSDFWIGFNTVTRKFVIDTSHDPQDFYDAKDRLVRVRDIIAKNIDALRPITPLVNGVTDPNSLLAKLEIVLKDITDTFVTSGGDQITSTTGLSALVGLRNWLLDNYNNPGGLKAGKFQQDIAFAITAGQSLNDTQNESVRRFLFIFEEYYKSASAVLQQITQIIERMAQNIGR